MKIKLTVQYKNRLKALMADAGFRSMAALAEETGISQNMLYMFERGEHHLGMVNLLKLLWALDCTFDELIQFEVDSNEPDHIDDLPDDIQSSIQKAKAEYQQSKVKKSKKRLA